MLGKRQYSLFALCVAIFWLSVGLAIARYSWLSISGWGLERRLLIVACFTWAGIGFAMADKLHRGVDGTIFGAIGGAAVGIYAQWSLAEE